MIAINEADAKGNVAAYLETYELLALEFGLDPRDYNPLLDYLARVVIGYEALPEAVPA